MLESKGVRAGRVVGWLAAIGLFAGVMAACVELEGSLGSDCLKDQDCQSGVCSQLHCAAVPPLLDAGFGPDAADAAADGAENPENDGSGMTGPDGSPADAPPGVDVVVPDGEAPDAPADAIEERPGPDAPIDAPVDSPADARQDAGEAG